MALPSSGELSLDGINTHLRRASGAAFSLNDAQARGLAGKPSGGISVSDFYGKWAGSHMQCWNQPDGSVGFSYNAAGQYIGQFAGCDMAFITWNGTLLWMRTHDGQSAKPSSINVIVRDDNFAAVASFSVTAWEAIGTNGWQAYATIQTNPFPHNTWRWITW